METEDGYLAITSFKSIMVAGSQAQIKLADEPTNIKWQGHERKNTGKIPKL
jgi:hypothetical protein